MKRPLSLRLQHVATDDDTLGIAWWNALSRSDRAKWLREAGSARPKDAWEAFKAAQGHPDVV